jgi:cell division protein FtsW
MTDTRRKPDYVLLATVGALVALGLVMVYSASFVEAFRQHDNQYYYLLRQMTGAMIGTVGLLVAQRLHYQFWQRYSVQFMTVALVLLVLVLILPESMTMVNNSRSWIRFGEGVFGLFSVQPSELAKLALIIYFADWLSRRGQRVGNVTYGLIPFAVMLGLVCGLVMLEPDFGTTVVIVIIASAIYFVAGANLWHVLGATTLGAAAFWLLVRFSGFRDNLRIKAFLDPWQYYDGPGYQPIHALYALGSGGLFGAGLGQSRQKFQWLPQAHTDAILAIIGEELGLIGTMIVLGAFCLIAYRGYKIALRAPNPFAALVATGITTWLVFQGLINMAVTTSLIPFTGLTLPFLSYGNTSLIVSLVSTGILLNISRHTVPRSREELSDGPIVRRSPALPILAAVAEWGRNGRSRLSGPGSRRGFTRRR